MMSIHPKSLIDAASAKAVTADAIHILNSVRQQVAGFNYDRKVVERPTLRSTLVRLCLNFSYGSEKTPYTTCLRNDLGQELDWLEAINMDGENYSTSIRNAAVALLRLQDSGLLENGEPNFMPKEYYDHEWRNARLQRFDSLPLKDKMGLGIYDCCYDSDQSIDQLLKTYQAILDSQLQIRETIEEASASMARPDDNAIRPEDDQRMYELLGLLQESVNNFDQFLCEQLGQLYDTMQTPPDRWKGR